MLLAGLTLAGLLGLRPLATAQPGAPAQPESRALLEYELNTIEIMRRYGPSVVTIDVEVQGRRLSPFEGVPEGEIPPQFRNLPPQLRQGTGTGFLIDVQRRIVTNYHVVRLAMRSGGVELLDGARLSVRFPGIDGAFEARVLGANALYDLALLEFVDVTNLPAAVYALPVLRLADSDQVVPGQKAIAIGNPFGFENTVTVGTVSGISRSLLDVGEADLPFIQVDAAINPGNSGGPLLDSRGEVIGINTAILPGSSLGGPRGFIGLGFAVPSNILARSLPALRGGGLVNIDSTPRVGIRAIGLDSYSPGLRAQLGLPESGAMIIEVEPGGPGALAGLRAATSQVMGDSGPLPTGGDVVLAIDGLTVRTAGELQGAILARSAGEVLVLRVWRGGEEIIVTVTLARVP